MPRVLITVGSTKFDQLVQTCLSTSVISALAKKGFTELVIQYGNSKLTPRDGLGIQTTVFAFKSSLSDEFAAADLIISHAGSGTIIEVLTLGKPLIIVPNETLMDNHQVELAQALHTINVCRVGNIQNLPQTIEQFEPTKLTDIPVSEPGRFSTIIDEEMGFG